MHFQKCHIGVQHMWLNEHAVKYVPNIDTKHTSSNDNLSVFKNSQEEKIFKSTLLELTRITRLYCMYKAVVQFITTGTHRTVNAFNVF